jgi:hypothetical protein
LEEVRYRWPTIESVSEIRADMEDELQRTLLGLRWPTDESGYLTLEEDSLPPYRVLKSLLAARGIHRDLTWTKQDCLNALGGWRECTVRGTLSVTEHLLARVRTELHHQREVTRGIREATAGLGPIVETIVSELEETHVQRQLLLQNPPGPMRSIEEAVGV